MDRILSKFEEESLFDWWIEEYADQYSLEENEFYFKKWKNNLSWSEIDEIMSHYTK